MIVKSLSKKLHPKQGEIFRVTIFGGKSDKKSNFLTVGLNMPRKMATVLSPLGEYGKILTSYLISVSSLQSKQKRSHLNPISMAPYTEKNCKNRNLHNTKTFLVSVVAYCVFFG